MSDYSIYGRCVVCNGKLAGETPHKCPPRVEAAYLAAHNRAEEPNNYTPSEGERLAYGFAMLSGYPVS